jgi:hypothetical protein
LRDKISYPYSTTGKITVLYILVLRFLILESIFNFYSFHQRERQSEEVFSNRGLMFRVKVHSFLVRRHLRSMNFELMLGCYKETVNIYEGSMVPVVLTI